MWTRKDWISGLGFGAIALAACFCVMAAHEWGRPPEPAILPPKPPAKQAGLLGPPVITPGVPMTDEEIDFLAHPPLSLKDE